MKTVLLSDTEADLEQAAAWIQKGEVVGMPTETVYGLAADACNPEAVKKVFAAKGRPADNPLIVHISEMEQLSSLVESIPELAYHLAECFIDYDFSKEILYSIYYIGRIGHCWYSDACSSYCKAVNHIIRKSHRCTFW